MITITKISRELTKKETYEMTMSPVIQKISNNKGAVIAVSAFCIYSDEKIDGKTGEVHDEEILSIMDDEGTVYATNSPTFKKDFENIAELMDGEDFQIEVITGTSKAGREFVTCTLV